MKPWYEQLFDFLAGLLTKGRLLDAGADVGRPMPTITIPIPGTGYDRASEEAAQRGSLVAFMRSQLGKPYSLGIEIAPGEEADAPAWDCSEETEAAYRKAGMAIPDGAQQQFTFCQPVKTPKPGDLGFLWSDKRVMIGHVMMATGDGTVVHAVAGRGVVEDSVTMWETHLRWRGWRRHPDFSWPLEDRA